LELQQRLKSICDAFRITGKYIGYEHIKIGNVNQTYKVYFRKPDNPRKAYIVQKINTYAFHEPERLMDNADRVTEHIRAKKQGEIALHYHHTCDRKTFVYDEEGGFWRLCNFIPSETYNNSEDGEVLRQAGAAFGEFQRLVSDFPASELYETIPDFHNTPKRLATLFADAKKDAVDRCSQVQAELEYLATVREEAEKLTHLYEQGVLPLRVTHNDTKINNVLFDAQTSRAMAVVDLDTVMPGLIGHDFGDGIRAAANTVEEDCPDCEKVFCDLEKFKAFTEGFLSQTKEFLTPAEKDTLALSVFAITVELASRFLDDYINGDLYFNISYPEHNLVRARCQIALAKDIYKKLGQMQAIVDACMMD